MGGIAKKVAGGLAMGSGDSAAPKEPKQVAGGGIETPIKSAADAVAAKKKKEQQSVSLLGQGGERKVGL